MNTSIGNESHFFNVLEIMSVGMGWNTRYVIWLICMAIFILEFDRNVNGETIVASEIICAFMLF